MNEKCKFNMIEGIEFNDRDFIDEWKEICECYDIEDEVKTKVESMINMDMIEVINVTFERHNGSSFVLDVIPKRINQNVSITDKDKKTNP